MSISSLLNLTTFKVISSPKTGRRGFSDDQLSISVILRSDQILSSCFRASPPLTLNHREKKPKPEKIHWKRAEDDEGSANQGKAEFTEWDPDLQSSESVWMEPFKGEIRVWDPRSGRGTLITGSLGETLLPYRLILRRKRNLLSNSVRDSGWTSSTYFSKSCFYSTGWFLRLIWSFPGHFQLILSGLGDAPLCLGWRKAEFFL